MERVAARVRLRVCACERLWFACFERLRAPLQGPPTIKVAWALLPFMALADSLRATSEYRQERRVLVDNACKAMVIGAKHMIDETL